jgi:hypothetical protein
MGKLAAVFGHARRRRDFARQFGNRRIALTKSGRPIGVDNDTRRPIKCRKAG